MPTLINAKRICLAGALAASSACCMADTVYEDEPYLPWKASATFGVSDNDYEIDFGIAYFPIPYVGLRVEIGLPMELNSMPDFIIDSWGSYDDYYYYNDNNYTARFTFSPSVVVRTPRLFSLESAGIDFHLFASPGITLSPGASGSYKSRWFYWRGEAGIEAAFDRFSIALSYKQSNFYLYDGFQSSDSDVSCKGERTHSVLLTGTYSF